WIGDPTVMNRSEARFSAISSSSLSIAIVGFSVSLPQRLARRRLAGSVAPQQVVDRGLGPRPGIHPLDDHRTREAVLAVRRRQAAGHDDGAGGDPAVVDPAGLALVDAGRLTDED